MSNQSEPTPEQLRAARHRGFTTSLGHLPPARRDRLVSSYKQQDARRERNVASFVNGIRAGK